MSIQHRRPYSYYSLTREFARYPEQQAYDLDSFVEEIKLQQPTKEE